jgi:hypothetical protein
MEKHEVDIAVQSLYTELVEEGSTPLAIAASFMVSAFLIYSSELSKKDYLEVVEGLFSKADRFIEKRYNTLN